MELFQTLLLLVLGFGILLVVYQSLDKGWLPCGPSGIRRRLELYRDEQPLAYWFLFVGYTAGGLWCVFTALGIASGQVEPLPLN